MSWLPTADTPGTTPIACALDTAGLQRQEQRWAELVRRASTGRAATGDGVTLTFRADPRVERELRELVAIETKCCAWARWEVRTGSDGEPAMHASATGDGVAVLQSMFPRAT